MSLAWVKSHTFIPHFNGYVYYACQLPESHDSNMIQHDSGSTMKNIYILSFTPRVVTFDLLHGVSD